MEEGLAQLFIQQQGRRKIVGTVGALQYEVIQYRLTNEYGAACRFEMLPYSRACWIASDNPAALKDFIRYREEQIGYDQNGKPVYFAESEWMLRSIRERYPEISFYFTSEWETDGAEPVAGVASRPA
jgi:peptide chain release factor 3